MSSGLGNQLNQIIQRTIGDMFETVELSQLAFLSFENAAKSVGESTQEETEVQYPIGVRPDGTLMTGNSKYTKEDLIGRYQYLAHHQLCLNGLYQLVTISEAMVGDICRAVILCYPKKMGGKRTFPLSIVLEAKSIEAAHLFAADALLNELSYKSPREMAESVRELIGVNLLEVPAFHRYIELKATRDIYIHNRGIANAIYLEKAGSHARAAIGIPLPISPQYFLQGYEACLQVAESLERSLHERWPSQDFEERLAKRLAPAEGTPDADV